MSLSREEIIARLAERTSVPAESIAKILLSLAQLGYEEAGKGFMVPGFGKLSATRIRDKVGRNPATGASIKIPGKIEFEFKIHSAAEDAILDIMQNPEKAEIQEQPAKPGKTLPLIRLMPTYETVKAAGLGPGGGALNRAHQVGGEPDWLQGPEEAPICCEKEMTFYGQLDSISGGHEIGDGGIIYVFLCYECLKSKSFVQCS